MKKPNPQYLIVSPLLGGAVGKILTAEEIKSLLPVGTPVVFFNGEVVLRSYTNRRNPDEGEVVEGIHHHFEWRKWYSPDYISGWHKVAVQVG